MGLFSVNTNQQRESMEEGFVDPDGNIVVSKKMTRVVTTTRTTYEGGWRLPFLLLLLTETHTNACHEYAPPLSLPAVCRFLLFLKCGAFQINPSWRRSAPRPKPSKGRRSTVSRSSIPRMATTSRVFTGLACRAVP